MRAKLQALRDEAERQCELACHRNDTDSAAAWEQIGIELDELQERIKLQWRVIEERQPIGGRS